MALLGLTDKQYEQTLKKMLKNVNPNSLKLTQFEKNICTGQDLGILSLSSILDMKTELKYDKIDRNTISIIID